MKVNVKLDANAINKFKEAAKRSAAITAEALMTDVVSAQVIPFDTGDMQNNQTFTAVESHPDGFIARLITGSPQARRLYYHPEYNFQTVNNPNAKGLWLEDWITGEHASFVSETFKETFKKEAGL